MKRSAIILSLVLVLGCQKDSDIPPSPVYAALHQIHSDFTPYVQRFRDASKSRSSFRSIQKSVDSLTIRYDDRIGAYCGLATSFGVTEAPSIKISPSPFCWSQRSDFEKEILIFHELGHAILKRSHTNDTLPNGDWKSIMLGGDIFGLYMEEEPEMRSYYIDELLNQDTPIPEWAGG